MKEASEPRAAAVKKAALCGLTDRRHMKDATGIGEFGTQTSQTVRSTLNVIIEGIAEDIQRPGGERCHDEHAMSL